MGAMHTLQPVNGARECSLVPFTLVAIDVFMTIDPATLTHEQKVEFGVQPPLSLRFRSTGSSSGNGFLMPFHFIRNDLPSQLHYPRNLRRRSTVHDQIVVPLIGLSSRIARVP